MPKAPLKPATIDIAPAEPALATGWSRVRRYAEHAALFQRASLACQIMAGFELIALRDRAKSKGGRPKAGNLSDCRTSFLDEVEKLGGISRSTAYEWIDMARLAKPRLAKGDFDLAKILDKHPAALTPAEQELLKKAVHKISDGRTQLQFLLDCGVTKQVQGGAARGGAAISVRPRAPAPAATVQDQLEAERQSAITWHQEHCPAWRQRWLVGREFRHLPDTAEHGGELTLAQFAQLLTDTLAAVQAEQRARAKSTR